MTMRVGEVICWGTHGTWSRIVGGRVGNTSKIGVRKSLRGRQTLCRIKFEQFLQEVDG